MMCGGYKDGSFWEDLGRGNMIKIYFMKKIKWIFNLKSEVKNKKKWIIPRTLIQFSWSADHANSPKSGFLSTTSKSSIILPHQYCLPLWFSIELLKLVVTYESHSVFLQYTTFQRIEMFSVYFSSFLLIWGNVLNCVGEILDPHYSTHEY